MSAERDPARDQRMPVPNGSRPIHEQVMDDLRERMEFGTRKYGTPLQSHNGRNPLLDAYEEALDLACYLKQAVEEQRQLEQALVEQRQLEHEVALLRKHVRLSAARPEITNRIE